MTATSTPNSTPAQSAHSIPAKPASSTRQVPDVHEMVVVHRVFRRELPLLAQLIRDVPDGDARRAAQVGGHLQLILTGLHMHHTGEDDVLWPRLLERATPSADLIHTMEVQHHRVERQITRLDPAVAEWISTAVDGVRLATMVDEVADALFEHLDLEEREILPLAEQHLSAAEWALMGEHGRELMTPRQLPIMFGAVLEDADADERAGMLGALPLPIRLLLRTVGAWQYRRYITRVRGDVIRAA